MSRIHIALPEGAPQMLVKRFNADGSEAPGPWRLISGGETEPFEIDLGQVLTVEIHPEKEG